MLHLARLLSTEMKHNSLASTLSKDPESHPLHASVSMCHLLFHAFHNHRSYRPYAPRLIPVLIRPDGTTCWPELGVLLRACSELSVWGLLDTLEPRLSSFLNIQTVKVAYRQTQRDLEKPFSVLPQKSSASFMQPGKILDRCWMCLLIKSEPYK